MEVIEKAYLKFLEIVPLKVLDQNDLPLFKHIDMWANQTDFVNEDGNTEYPFDTPALFIDFNVIDVHSIGLLQDDLTTDITFYVVHENYADTHLTSSNKTSALQYLKLCTKLHAQLQGYQHIDVGTLRRTRIFRKPGPPNVLVYGQTYSVILRDDSAFEAKKQTETVTVDAELEVVKRPVPPAPVQETKFFDIT